jgi:hypothetical protein
MATATWTRLRDGSWGVRGENLVPGNPVVVTRKDGTRSTVTVGEIVWVGHSVGQDNLVLATVEVTRPRKATPRPAPRPQSFGCEACDGEGCPRCGRYPE